MSLFCRLGWHHGEYTHGRRAAGNAPAVSAHWRCARCGREKPLGLDNSDRTVNVKFSGHLTVAEVRRIRRRGIRPAYVSPQVEAELAKELAARAEAAQKRKDARKRKGPAVVEQIRRMA